MYYSNSWRNWLLTIEPNNHEDEGSDEGSDEQSLLYKDGNLVLTHPVALPGVHYSCFIDHPNGPTCFMPTAEYMAHAMVDLNTNEVFIYNEPEAERGWGWIWLEVREVTPTLLVVRGCWWDSWEEWVFYDIRDRKNPRPIHCPDLLPGESNIVCKLIDRKVRVEIDLMRFWIDADYLECRPDQKYALNENLTYWGEDRPDAVAFKQQVFGDRERLWKFHKVFPHRNEFVSIMENGDELVMVVTIRETSYGFFLAKTRYRSFNREDVTHIGDIEKEGASWSDWSKIHAAWNLQVAINGGYYKEVGECDE